MYIISTKISDCDTISAKVRAAWSAVIRSPMAFTWPFYST